MSKLMLIVGALMVVASATAAAQSAAVGSETAKTPPSPWVIGDSAPQNGRVVEAWFDRRVPPTVNPTSLVTVGSPSKMSVWLRTVKQSCQETEPTARRATDQTDGPLLYVCARLRDTGEFRLVAATDAPVLIVSDAIKVADAELVSPAVSAAITTIVGFLVGMATSYVQGAIQLRREDKSTQKAVEKTLVEVLAREILDNHNELHQVIAGGTPTLLKTAAYNNDAKLGSIAWGYLNSPAAAGYRQNLDTLYKTDIPVYQAAVKAWTDTGAANTPEALAPVVAAAIVLVARLGQFKG